MISPTTVPGINTTSAVAPISTAVAALPTRLTRTLFPTTILPMSVNRSRPTSIATAQAGKSPLTASTTATLESMSRPGSPRESAVQEVRHSREHEECSRQAIRPGEQQRNHDWHHEEPREGEGVGHRENAVLEPSCFVWLPHSFIRCSHPDPHALQIIPLP